MKNWFRSASPYAGDAAGAWGVSFNYGGVDGYGPDGLSYRVRLVR